MYTISTPGYVFFKFYCRHNSKQLVNSSCSDKLLDLRYFIAKYVQNWTKEEAISYLKLKEIHNDVFLVVVLGNLKENTIYGFCAKLARDDRL